MPSKCQRRETSKHRSSFVPQSICVFQSPPTPPTPLPPLRLTTATTYTTTTIFHISTTTITASTINDATAIASVTSSLPIALPAPEEAHPDLDTSGDLFLSPPRQGVSAIQDALEAGTEGALDVGTKGALELEDPSCTGSEACPVSARDDAVENEEFGEEGESQLCSQMTESQLSRRTSRNTKRKNSKEPARGGKNLRSHGEENQGERRGPFQRNVL